MEDNGMFNALYDVINRADNNELTSRFAEDANALYQIANIVANIIIGVAFGVSFITLAYSMVMFVTSGGNPDKTKKAWNAFLWSVIAGLIAVFAVGLARLLKGLMGVPEGMVEI